MAKVTFFEKTGCVNNTKQKRILALAGHTLEAIDLIHYNWTKEELVLFFEGVDVPLWFNTNAPKVQTGEVNPKSFTKEQALEALVKDHLLIKRPLMIIGQNRLVGFDKDKLAKLIGLDENKGQEVQTLLSQNLVDCPQKSKGASCD